MGGARASVPVGEAARSESAPPCWAGASARAPLSPPTDAGDAASMLLARCCGRCGGWPPVADPPVRGDVALPGGEAQPWPDARCPRTSSPACRLRREKVGDPSGTDCDLHPGDATSRVHRHRVASI